MATGALAISVLAACYVPAHRAARVDGENAHGRPNTTEGLHLPKAVHHTRTRRAPIQSGSAGSARSAVRGFGSVTVDL